MPHNSDLSGVTGDFSVAGAIAVRNTNAAPSAPVGGTTLLYSYAPVSGKPVLAIRTSDEIVALQKTLWGTKSCWWTPTGATAGVWTNTVGTSAGTYANGTISAATKYRYLIRSRYSNVITTTNQNLGLAQSNNSFVRNSSTSYGGYLFYASVGFETWTNGGRMFVGMTASSPVASIDGSTVDNSAAFIIEEADAGLISFLTRRTSGFTTKTSTGLTASSLSGFETYIYCAAGSSQYTWRIVNIDTGAEASGTVSTDLPQVTTLQRGVALASNANLTAANAIQFTVTSIFIEA